MADITQTILTMLAVWRVTHLLVAEDGPWSVLVHLRAFLLNYKISKVLDCFYCLSIWVAIPFALWLTQGWYQWIVMALALSAGAIVIHEILQKISNTETAEYYEQQED
jgi:hypothetical protein